MGHLRRGGFEKRNLRKGHILLTVNKSKAAEFLPPFAFMISDVLIFYHIIKKQVCYICYITDLL